MLAVLTEFSIVKNCYKFTWSPTIMQSLVVTLLSGTQNFSTVSRSLPSYVLASPTGKGSIAEPSSWIAPLNTQTLPPDPIDLDPPICFAVDYNFRHTYCYWGYNKLASLILVYR